MTVIVYFSDIAVNEKSVDNPISTCIISVREPIYERYFGNLLIMKDHYVYYKRVKLYTHNLVITRTGISYLSIFYEVAVRSDFPPDTSVAGSSTDTGERAGQTPRF